MVQKGGMIVKRVSYLTLALALVLSLTACSIGSKKFERGVVEGQTYTSQFLGLTCTAPTEYTYLNDQEIAQLNDLTADVVDSEELVKQMRESLENGNQVQDMYLMTADGLQTVNVMLVKVSAKGAAVDMAAFADMGKDQVVSAYQSMGMTDVEASRETVTFMGQQYEGICTSATYTDVPVTTVQVCMQVGNYVCVITFTSYVEDHTPEMMDFFSPLATE